jgi:hypothetical protein
MYKLQGRALPSRGSAERSPTWLAQVARPCNPVLERLPLQQLHDDEPPAFVFADVINATDVRMIEGRGGARFSDGSAR